MANSWKIYKYPHDAVRKWCYRLKFIFVKPLSDIDKAKYSWSKTHSKHYPYTWLEEYHLMEIEVYSDVDNGLKYVLHKGKKLYFKRSFSTQSVKWCYKSLLIEQDPRSAHRYVSNYDQLKDKTLLDVGAAEGIFALEVINDLSYLYLFECEKEWIEALEATFAPWKTKVTIIPKYVNDISDENNISLDDYLAAISTSNIFIKMDIEGFESAAFKGAEKLLSQNDDIMGAIAIYHKDEDEKEFSALFTRLGFNIETQEGYICFENVFRRAILRFWK